MDDLDENFVPVEIAGKLEELGFNWECLAEYWWVTYNVEHLVLIMSQELLDNHPGHPRYEVGAPLWQQAFDWFRVEHGLYSYVKQTHIDREDNFTWYIESARGIVLREVGEPKFKEWIMANDTYESARLACLEKLIELLTKRKK